MADLTKPRIKVMKDWPGRKDFEVGQVITLDKTFGDGSPVWEIGDCQGVRTYTMAFFEMFPAEFKKLQWWEHRKPEEMPGFIKYDDISLYVPVTRICKVSEANFEAYGFETDNFQPATETEYLNYLKAKKVWSIG